MKLNPQGLMFAVGFLAAFLIAGCEKEQPQKTEAPPPTKHAQTGNPEPARAEPARPQPPNPESDAKPTPGEADKPPTGDSPPEPVNFHKPPEPGKPAASGEAATVNGNELSLTGLVMTVPAGWTKGDAGPGGPMSPKAVFHIEGDGGDFALVRITHFPEMKGTQMNDMNIDRWLRQVSKPDGSPTPREEAKIETKEKGDIRLTIVDARGAVKATMGDNPKPDSRLIAAIVDHSQGPHFIVAAGSAAILDKAASDVRAFIESAKVSP